MAKSKTLVVKNNNLFQNGDLKFDEKEHKYVNSEGKHLISATQFVHLFVPEFDPTGEILKKCALKKGVTEEELQKEWNKIKDDACARGTNFHTEAEYFIDTGKIRKSPDQDIIKQFKKIKPKGKRFSEVRVHDNDLGMAGAVDLLEFVSDNTVELFDFKTNKNLSTYSIYGDKLLYPVSHYYNVNFTHYELQLSLYAYLLELNGLWVDNLTIYYINPKTRIIEIHPVRNLRKDILNMIESWKNGQIGKPPISQSGGSIKAKFFS